MGKKLLTISLLVSGREDTTEKCLKSIKPLLDKLDSELILVDTGCSKELREKLFEYTENIVSFKWSNDFASARNAGLEKAAGKWFLFLDDDEWFDDVTPIIAFFESGEYQKYGQAVYKARNYSTIDGGKYSDEWVSRMIHLTPGTHFEGKVHESLVPVADKCKMIDAFVHHFGYAFANDEERLAHSKRNTEILLGLMKEEPDNMRWPLHLLKEYLSTKDTKKLQQLGFDAIVKLKDVDEPFLNLCRGAFYCAVLQSDIWTENEQKLLNHLEEYRADARNSYAANCALEKTGSNGLFEEKNMSQVATCCENYFAQLKEFQKQEMTEQEQIILDSILFVNEAVKEETQNEMCLKWAESLATTDRMSELPQKQQQTLQAYLMQYMNGNGEFLKLPSYCWKYGQEGILPIEEMLLQLPMSQWMVQVIVLQNVKDMKLWESMYQYLKQIQTKEDLRYAYFNFNYINAKIEAPIDDVNYETMQSLFEKYVEYNMNYARLIYNDTTFQNSADFMPVSVRGAMWVQKAYACGFEKFDQMLEDLGKCVKEHPAVADQMKQYIRLLGDKKAKQMVEQEEEASEARDELQVMAEQVKEQVQVMMQSQMYAEAYSIVQQLRGMLPNDQELILLEKELQTKFS